MFSRRLEGPVLSLSKDRSASPAPRSRPGCGLPGRGAPFETAAKKTRPPQGERDSLLLRNTSRPLILRGRRSCRPSASEGCITKVTPPDPRSDLHGRLHPNPKSTGLWISAYRAGGAVSGRPPTPPARVPDPQRKAPTGGWVERGRRGLITATGPAGPMTHRTGYLRIGVRSEIGKRRPFGGRPKSGQDRRPNASRAIPALRISSSPNGRPAI